MLLHRSQRGRRSCTLGRGSWYQLVESRPSCTELTFECDGGGGVLSHRRHRRCRPAPNRVVGPAARFAAQAHSSCSDGGLVGRTGHKHRWRIDKLPVGSRRSRPGTSSAVQPRPIGPATFCEPPSPSSPCSPAAARAGAGAGAAGASVVDGCMVDCCMPYVEP
eukprot:SAG11_NODE_2214_length_3680_cov_33.077632_2_plen_163_part_00